jgi:hypothetical protein
LTFKFKLEDDSLFVSISNDSVPAGQLPEKRQFKMEGTVGNPALVEGGNERTVEAVFDDVIAWFRKEVRSHSASMASKRRGT